MPPSCGRAALPAGSSMEAAMTKLRQVLSTFSAHFTDPIKDEPLFEVTDQEIADALYRRSERSDTGDTA